MTACGKYRKTHVFKTRITDLELSTTPLTNGCRGGRQRDDGYHCLRQQHLRRPNGSMRS